MASLGFKGARSAAIGLSSGRTIMVIDGMARHVMTRVLEETDLGEPGTVAGDLLAALDAAGYQIVQKAQPGGRNHSPSFPRKRESGASDER
jgi:hypothetical protein